MNIKFTAPKVDMKYEVEFDVIIHDLAVVNVVKRGQFPYMDQVKIV